MTGIQPFDGMVVRPDAAHDVVSPAYDALTAEQRQHFRAQHGRSYLHVTRSAEDEPDAATVDNTTLANRGRAALEELLRANVFVSHGPPALFAYRLVHGANTQIGVVCEVPASYYHRVATPHEATRPERAELLADHFSVVKAASSPITCAVRDDGDLERELTAATHGAPVLDITSDDGLQQTVWRLDDAATEARVVEHLQDEPLFIIDGHHRSEANMALHRRGMSQPVLAAIFPAHSLHLVGFHRLVRLHPETDQADVLREIRRRFPVVTVSDVAAVARGTVAMVLADEWHVVSFDERPIAGGANILLGSLDPVVVERELLGIIGRLGTFEVAYTPDTQPFASIASDAAARGQVPIFVPPVAIDDMMAVAEGGTVMPAKSTYFTPKVRSGVFLRVFDGLG